MNVDPVALREGAVADAIRERRLIAVLRRVEPQSALLGLVDRLAEAGVRVFEITFDSPSAANDLYAVREQVAGLDGSFLVGAGTLLSPDHVASANRCGADFGVSPVLDVELTRSAIEAGLPFVPGAFTPTEMRAAWDAGATFVKLFPASAVGPQFIREQRGPLPHIQIIPTGGVDASNAGEFLAAGAAAIGIGSALARMSTEELRALVDAVGDR